MPIFSNGQNINNKTDSLEILLETASTHEERTDILLILSEEFAEINNLKSFNFAQEAYTLNQDKGQLQNLWKSCIAVSDAYYRLDSINRSNKLALEALKISSEMNDEKKQAYTQQQLGKLLIEQENFQLAGEYLYKAINYFEVTKDTSNLIMIYHFLGILHYYLKNNELSLKYYHKGLDLALSINDQKQIAAAYLNIAMLIEDYDKVMFYYRKGLEISTKMNNSLWISRTYMNMGISTYYQQEYSECYDMLHHATLKYDNVNNSYEIAVSYCYLAMTHFQLQSKDSAYYYAIKALNLSKTKMPEFLRVRYQTSNFLVDYFSDQNKIDSVLFYTILTHQLLDSLNQNEQTIRVNRLEQQYIFKAEQQKVAFDQYRKDAIKFLVIASLLAIIIIILLLYSRLKIKARHNKLQKLHFERELDYKNQELTSNVMSLMKRNELVAGLLDKLNLVEQNAQKEDVKDVIRKVASELSKIKDENAISEFEVRFKEVHKEFYDKLIKLYPDLWPSELKLCALLRLNMTTKEISELTGQNPSSIDKARYRIRKKLSITNTDTNLISFLSTIEHITISSPY